MGFLFDASGRVVDIPENERVVALHPDRLRKVETIIGVAGGASKAVAIHAVLRAHLIDVLVTDAVTAQQLLAMHESSALVEV
jgi:DNA-binding transcriptional regulator LsrR (DeoR family)